ncbi:beta-propeller fold lactonase family protein [Actinoplanes sp. NPDC051411]|uniref:beta-propeller fold lactonase family protein n=1 Tax=Actinoplanes sp. NPDC051411 TaxID=3155522 RepID=UPI00341C231A
MGELSSSVLVVSDGAVIAEEPEGNLPSAIVLDGDLLYVTNRGADTIAVFERSPALRRITEVPCGGRRPRDLVLDGSRRDRVGGRQRHP